MLRRLPLSIKLPPGSVTDEYIKQFTTAVMTFNHQVVFDPRSRKRQPLIPRGDGCCGLAEHPDDMGFAGRYPLLCVAAAPAQGTMCCAV